MGFKIWNYPRQNKREIFTLLVPWLFFFFPPPEDEWLLITLSSHLQSRILKEPGRSRPAGESAAPSNDYLMRLRPPLSLLWANTGRKCASPWTVPDASIHLSACKFLPLALISLCVCQRQTVTWGPLLCTGIGSKLCHWDLLMSSVWCCTSLAFSEFRTPTPLMFIPAPKCGNNDWNFGSKHPLDGRLRGSLIIPQNREFCPTPTPQKNLGQ